jgi:hypothetical protein
MTEYGATSNEFVIELLAHFVPPLIGSFFVIRSADLESYENSRLGSYLVRYMTPAAQSTRPIGALFSVFVAWYHSPLGITAGFVLVLCTWLYGLPSFPSDG